jgi:hypothetical protein
MIKRLFQSFLSGVLILSLALGLTLGGGTAPAYAIDNPGLLPTEFTPIIDLARLLTPSQKAKLTDQLSQLEAERGWKLRLLTQFDRTPGRAVKDYWKLDDKSILVVADSRGGNLLNFNVGGGFYTIFPRTFWIELQTRFGNQFYVRDNGEDRAILDSIDSLVGCLNKGGCNAVPGLPREQWILTLVSSILGGVICGFAAHPRKPGGSIAWQWALILSPLWGMLFLAFGIGPVVVRTSEFLPLFRNIAGFSVGALVSFLSYYLRESSSPSEG